MGHVITPDADGVREPQSKISLQERQSLSDEKDQDKFAIGETISSHETDEADWSALTTPKKVLHVCIGAAKAIGILTLLYFFICALDLLSVGFRIVGGPEPQGIFQNRVLSNPVVGLMCGIIFTVIVQSSSTTSSAVVGMVAGKLITVRAAIPIIMGANIGTSVTNTLISMLQVEDRDKFRRAFAAGTVHDMFNWLTTLVLLPFEILTGYLYHVSKFLVREIESAERSNSSRDIYLLKALTNPLTKKVVTINKTVTEHWSDPNITIRDMFRRMSSISRTGHLFANSGWNDRVIGGIVVAISFIVLLACLACLVKILNTILKGKIAGLIRRTAGAKLPYCPMATDYLIILMGAVLTFLVQSSSVFTSTLPPLVSIRVLTIERAYTLTLGSNIGTTTTAIVAALAQTKNFSEGMQIALCHLIFNATGLLLFFPIPWTRFPVVMAKFLGNTTASYRWFAIVYIVMLYILLPLVFMGLAFAGSVYVIVVAIILVTTFLFVTIVNYLRKYPRFLPQFLHTWDCLPIWMRSLKPYDDLFLRCACCKSLQRKSIVHDNQEDLGTKRDSKIKDALQDVDNETQAPAQAMPIEINIQDATK